MGTCPVCGSELPGEFPFCPFCGASLQPRRRESGQRRVVTALFCDLVGFTAASEHADPEDVAAMLAAYFQLARREIEAHGGVVEKFIGDAVVGVFGAPTAHEDDPERAVRAALRIVEGAPELASIGGESLRLRVGVNTGEVLVRTGVAPGSGEGFLAGDAVNTASRLQSAAPELGVAVGSATYVATRAVFAYEELPAVEAKGKSEPVPAYRPLHPLARFGTDITRTHDSPLVGREVDLALLKGLYDKAVAASSLQLVLVVGEAGIGKSRALAELFAYVDSRPELVFWRQGRCLPYGDGVTFWALGEIVKAHAGILETDPVAVAETKLSAVLPTDEDQAWLRRCLLPLIGVDVAAGTGRDELFAAWRRFLESLADVRPTVLVLEDLHWADAPMLEFVEHLADHAAGVPLLVVGTSRPELFEAHPTFGAGLPNVNRVNLGPLSREESGRLLAALLSREELAVGELDDVLERSGGNPLYVEEFVRYLRDRRPAAATVGARSSVPPPDSVQALIAARLDTLSPSARAVVGDAAVVGKVFWAGALAAMGNDPTDVAAALRELTRKQVVRPQRRSSVAGQDEYAFWHALTRDVGYGQLPRAVRAQRHEAVARWLEGVADQRVEDVADVVAHHYATAAELWRATGDEAEAERLRAPAVRYLTLAGHRAIGLDTTAALVAFERARSLASAGSRAWADAELGFAESAVDAGRYGDAATSAEQALAFFRAGHDRAAEAHALRVMAWAAFRTGENARRYELNREALSVLESLPASQEVVDALATVAGDEALQARAKEGFVLADRAVALAVAEGFDPTVAYSRRALARFGLGDAGCVDDYLAAIEHGGAAPSFVVGTAYANLAMSTSHILGPAAGLERQRAGLAFARARGSAVLESWMRPGLVDALIDVGRLDDALAEIASITAHHGDLVARGMYQALLARVAVVRSDAPAEFDLDELVAAGRRLDDPQWLGKLLGWGGVAAMELGQPSLGRELLVEMLREPLVTADTTYVEVFPSAVRAALAAGDHVLARRLAEGPSDRLPVWAAAVATAHAQIAESRSPVDALAGYADAVARWRALGNAPELAYALVGHGRCLRSTGAVDAARPLLAEARELFTSMGAPVRVAEVDRLDA